MTTSTRVGIYGDDGERLYAWCKSCGEVVYRLPGQRHGDGQVDSDDAPVWLLGNERDAASDGVDIDALPHIQCGCNA